MFSNFAASYATTTQLVVSLTAFLLVYGIYRILAFVYNELTSPIRHVPGPPNPSLIYGSFKKLTESVSRKLTLSCSDCFNGHIQNNSELQEDWINQYGSTVKYKALLGVS